PEDQLNDITLARLQSSQDGLDQTPEFGLPLVAVDVARVVGRLADHAERRSRVARLADHPELHGRVRQLVARARQLTSRTGRLADRAGPLIAGRRRGPDPAPAFDAGQREQPWAQLGGLGQAAER